MSVVRVVVAWSSEAMVESYVRQMGDQEGIEVVGTALDGAAAIEVVARTLPDVLLMSVELPVVAGPEVIGHLTAEFPQVGVVFLSNLPGTDFVREAAENGALCGLMCDRSSREVVDAVRHAAQGGTYFDPFVRQFIFPPAT